MGRVLTSKSQGPRFNTQRHPVGSAVNEQHPFVGCGKVVLVAKRLASGRTSGHRILAASSSLVGKVVLPGVSTISLDILTKLTIG